jgi:hypothetical protein
MKKIVVFTFALLLATSLSALEINEKLTSRILNVSRSKKTLLINRGLEDGLVVGDHAKFFLTTGVVARGVVVKASPTRSIWSVYRIVDGTKLFNDKVVNIKISNAVKITEDPTKSIYQSTPFSTGGSDVLVARGDDSNLADDLSPEEKSEIATFDRPGNNDVFSTSSSAGINKFKTLEAWGLVHFNNLSASIDNGGDETLAGSLASIDFSIGAEKYFKYRPGILSKLSFHLLVHSSSSTTTNIDGTQITNSVLEYGGGASFHFLAPALSYNRMVGFATIQFGIGSVSDQIQFNSSTVQTEQTFSGSSNFFSLGGGMKYFTESGFGGRALIDYYRRSESYVVEGVTEDTTTTRIVAGPRFMVGLAYRF